MYLHQQKGFTIKYLKFDILLSIELYFRKSFNNFSAELPLFSLWTVGSWRLWNQSLKYKYFRIFSYRDRPTHFIREKEKKYFHHRYVTNLHNSNRFSTTMTNIFILYSIHFMSRIQVFLSAEIQTDVMGFSVAVECFGLS